MSLWECQEPVRAREPGAWAAASGEDRCWDVDPGLTVSLDGPGRVAAGGGHGWLASPALVH